MTHARMTQPVLVFPESAQAFMALGQSVEKELSAQMAQLVHLRVSQVNACGVCIDLAYRALKKIGESDERLFGVIAWRDAPFFTAAERAALALAEAATRMSDRSDPVPDAIWDETVRHFNERQIAALLIQIAIINAWNRLNVSTHQVTGEWAKSMER
jgi:AhpD family alkylhydroperoxidase